MGRRLERASIVEAEPEGLGHLEANVSSSEPKAGNAVGASCPSLQATLALIPCKSQPLQLVSLSVKAFTGSMAPLICTAWKEKGQGGRTNHPESGLG